MGPGLERAFDLWSMVQEAAGVDLVALRKPVRNQVKKSAFSGTLGMSMFNSCCASENSCFSPEFNFYFFYIGFSMLFLTWRIVKVQCTNALNTRWIVTSTVRVFFCTGLAAVSFVIREEEKFALPIASNRILPSVAPGTVYSTRVPDCQHWSFIHVGILKFFCTVTFCSLSDEFLMMLFLHSDFVVSHEIPML